jgi:hypothetical protein
MRLPVFDEVWGEQFAEQIREYLDGLWHEVEAGGVAEETLSGYPFCGCEECMFREEMFLATKLVLEGQEAGKVWLEEADRV